MDIEWMLVGGVDGCWVDIGWSRRILNGCWVEEWMDVGWMLGGVNRCWVDVGWSSGCMFPSTARFGVR